MGTDTAIAWTDHTFNPWWGCARVSPGCTNCYAEALAKRYGHDVWGKGSDRRLLSDKHWAEPLKWDRVAADAGRPALVFCASMADVFEDHQAVTDERERLWELIDRTPHLIWQLLTKRPENVNGLVPAAWVDHQWPSNVWLGTTVEDQQRAIDRIPILLATGARVRFLSCEPLLERVDLPERALVPRAVVCQRGEPYTAAAASAMAALLRVTGKQIGWSGIDWVICGGESGPGHRALDLDAARALRDQCAAAAVPYFFKQVGGPYATAGGGELDGEQLKAFPPEARR